ncbi:hypothetical protein EBU95_20760, partial [bacterium]|nr:hypothetical protein [bacterium]
MSNPNLANINTTLLDTMTSNINTSPNARIIYNATTTSTLMKIVSFILTNKTPSSAALVNVRYFSKAKAAPNSNVSFSLFSNVLIPSNTSIQIARPSDPFYLVEGDGIVASANANGIIEAVISYESISELEPEAHALATTATPYPVDVLLVGGGGSGPYGGGGGGGLFKTVLEDIASRERYNILIGAGGSSASTVNGGDSNITLLKNAPSTPLVLASVIGGGFGPSAT